MSTFDLLPELAAELDRLVPLEPRPGDWSDVVRRAGPPRRFSRMPSRGRFVLLVGALLVLLVAVASATYLLLHDQPAPRPHSGALTVTAGGYNVEIIEVRPGGRTVVVWRCPAGIACGQPEGVDWSPDGRHVAFTLAAINGGSPSYLGLHILDIDTGRDIRLVGEHEPGPAALCRLLSPGRPTARRSPMTVPRSARGRGSGSSRRMGRTAGGFRRATSMRAGRPGRPAEPTSRSWFREVASVMGSTSSAAMAQACAAWSRMVRRPTGLQTAA